MRYHMIRCTSAAGFFGCGFSLNINLLQGNFGVIILA
jgi:hypothetical protein